MEIKIRKARKDDLKRIVNATNRAYNIPFDPMGLKHKYKEPYSNVMERFLKKEIDIFVACYENRIVGALRYEFLEDNLVNLFKIAVLKSFRNKGIAPNLIKRVEIEAKKKGYTKIRLDCMREKNLVPYYKKFGFMIDRVQKHHDHHDVYMSKIIKN